MVQCIISDTRVNTIDKLRFEELDNLKDEHHQTFLDVFSLHLGGYHGECSCILVLHGLVTGSGACGFGG
jgi:hypothetical protein